MFVCNRIFSRIVGIIADTMRHPCLQDSMMFMLNKCIPRLIAVNALMVARQVGSALLVWLLAFGMTESLFAQTYVPAVSPRADVLLNSGWHFIRQDVSGAQTNGFDDSTWTNLDLPHTWNNLDGQDGGNNYYRGIGWYRRHYTVDGSYNNRHILLKFDGAVYVADAYVKGPLRCRHLCG